MVDLLNEIRILDFDNIIVKSNKTHMFKVDDETYAINYNKINSYVLIDFYKIDYKNDKPILIDYPVKSAKAANKIFSYIITSIALYIKENKPNTLKICCVFPELIKLYDHLFEYLHKIPGFHGYLIDKKENKLGVVYTISSTDNKFIKLVEKYLKEDK